MGSKKFLQITLFIGFFYFLLMAAAHIVGIKIPLLYIYFNLPSYGYQDKIISLLAFGWSVFFLKAALSPIHNRNIVQLLTIIVAVALAGLIRINYGTDFSQLGSAINPALFWYEFAALFIYWLLLLLSSRKFYSTEV